MEKDALVELAAGGVAQFSREPGTENNGERQRLNLIYRSLLERNPEDIDFNKTADEIRALRKLA